MGNLIKKGQTKTRGSGMSRTTQSGSQISLVRIPNINRLDLEQVIEFAASIKRTPLNPAQIEELKKYMAADPAYIEIARLHNNFIGIKDNYNLLMGLTPQQTQELHQLIKTTREFRELRKTKEVATGDIKNFLQNEKRVAPLSHIVDWWTTNCESLKKLEVWENIGVMIATESKQNQEAETITRKKLHHLTDIKNDWIAQQFFAGYSTSQLVSFYTDYLCKIETWVSEFLRQKENHQLKQPACLREYLGYILQQLGELKRHAINSFIARLRCCEYYQDLSHDDLLNYVSDQIKQNCSVSLFKSNNNPIRRSNSIALIKASINIVVDYLKQHPDERNLAQHFQLLKMRHTPEQWHTMFSDVYKVTANPIVVFIENLLPGVIEELLTIPNLPTLVLETDLSQQHEFSLRKLHRLMKYVTQERQTLLTNKLDTTNIAIDKILQQHGKKINSVVTEIGIKINIAIQKEIAQVLDDVFSDTEITNSRLGHILLKINNANDFYKKYQDLDYNHCSDLILQLGLRIKLLLSRNQNIMPIAIRNILKLNSALMPDVKTQDLEGLKKVLAKLPDTAQKLNEENEAELQHLLVHFLEAPQLSHMALKHAVERHQHIAQVYKEKWDNTFKLNPGMTEEQEYVFLICSYIKNVLIKVIPISPYIDFNNFDDNEMCSTLLNIEADHKRDGKKCGLQPSQIDSIQKEFQENIFLKLNDLFQIKSYLRTDTANIINIENLKSLLNRINTFFTIPEYKKAILASILKTVKILVKNYCLTILQQDIPLDRNYIYALNNLFNENLLLKMSDDAEINKTLATYMETYNGSKNTLTTFLIELIPISTTKTEPLLNVYAKKRLDYIKSSRDANADDYLFFNNFTESPTIKTYLLDAKKHFQNLCIAATKQLWNKNIAYLLELFADNETLYTYRLQHINELLNIGAALNEDDCTKLALEFDSTINPARTLHGRIVPATALASDGTLFTEHVDHLIANKQWSFMLESLLDKCGSTRQSQQMHVNLSLEMLHKSTSNLSSPRKRESIPADEWLAKYIKSNSDNLRALDELDTSSHLEKDFYLQFFGANHIKLLCENLDQLINLLTKANLDFNQKQLNKDDYKNLIQIINCIKPFARFYAIFGSNKIAKTTIDGLSALENKLGLHYNLHTVLKRQTSLLNISQDNVELHNLILAIVDTIRKIESKQILTEDGINSYLIFFDKEVLAKLDILLNNANSPIPFKALYLLSNLMIYLASNNTKMLLVEANKKHILTNPRWLTLINHFDERKVVVDLSKAANDAEFKDAANSEFPNILQFAQHLNSMRAQTHALIKQAILKEADIVVTPKAQLKLPQLFKGMKLKPAQYLKLWTACSEKLLGSQVDSQLKLSYVSFLIKFLSQTANEVLIKARDDAALLTEFIPQLVYVYKIKDRLNELTTETDKINSPRKNKDTCLDKTELVKALRPLFVVIDKALALQLMHKIDKFCLKIISAKELPKLRDIYIDTDTSKPQNNIAAIKFALGLTNQKEMTKLSAVIPIYHALQKIYGAGEESSHFITLIDGLTIEAQKNPILKKSSSYMETLTELKTLAMKYFSLQDNREFLFKTTSKHHLSL